MKKILATFIAGAALAAGATAAQAETRQERGEARLAEMLDGFAQAGDPVSCISAMRSNDIHVIPYVGIVYDAGETIYVARASNPRHLSDNDVPVIERHTSQLCSSDVTRTIDRTMPNFQGLVFLDDFVPYSRTSDEG